MGRVDRRRIARFNRPGLESILGARVHDANYDAYMDEYVLLLDSSEFSEYKIETGTKTPEVRVIVEVKTIDGKKYQRFEFEEVEA